MTGMRRRAVASAAVPLVALLVDRHLGEPARLHPVVGIGRLLAVATTVRDPPTTAGGALAAGAVGLAGCLVVAVTVARVLEDVLACLPTSMAVSLEGAVLSTLLADALLRSEGRRVEAALVDDLPAGRRALAGLVSRDTTTLDVDEVRAAAIESLAENTGDSIVAPLLAWAVGGLPGAAAYRVINTADASWGYRGAPWEWWGKPAARLDDLVNLVPARLAALLLAPRLFATATGRRRTRREAVRTPSPNAGWPIAAVAIDRGLCLAKPGVYVVNADGRAAGSDDVMAIECSVARAAVAAAGLAAVAGVLVRCMRAGP